MLPYGQRVGPVLAAALVAAGIWVAVAPASVPGLTEPGADTKMDEMLTTHSASSA